MLEEDPKAALVLKTDDLLTEGKHAMFLEEENDISLLKENNDEKYEKIVLDELPVEKTNEQNNLTNHRIRWSWAGYKTFI